MKSITLLCLLAVGLVFAFLISACTTTPTTSGTKTIPTTVAEWMDIELKDVRTGETFRISDFEGRPVLLESFAVWCPTCLAQQKEIEKLKISQGEAIVHISLDTDPNEDEDRIREHLETHGFYWLFAVSPIELTNALIDEFGLGVVNAPGAPVVLICEDLTARYLRSGVKTENALLEEVEIGCQ
jgi:thiol-disulfide isomerase/thioredoxin